jgi:hypothetical protein
MIPAEKWLRAGANTFSYNTGQGLSKIRLFFKNFNINFDRRDMGWKKTMSLVMRGKSKAENLKSKENWKRLCVIERFFLLLRLSYTPTLKPI